MRVVYQIPSRPAKPPAILRALVAEMAACLSMPVNIAMCDSSQHNFASAKLDHMTYGDKIAAVRASLSVKVLDRVFFKWLEEYAVVRGGIGADELVARLTDAQVAALVKDGDPPQFAPVKRFADGQSYAVFVSGESLRFQTMWKKKRRQ